MVCSAKSAKRPSNRHLQTQNPQQYWIVCAYFFWTSILKYFNPGRRRDKESRMGLVDDELKDQNNIEAEKNDVSVSIRVCLCNFSTIATSKTIL
jgi:hypothetical protein